MISETVIKVVPGTQKESVRFIPGTQKESVRV